MFFIAEMQTIVFFFMAIKQKFHFSLLITKIWLSSAIIIMELPDKTTWSEDPLAMGHCSLRVGTFGQCFQQFLKCNHPDVILHFASFLVLKKKQNVV